jgi:hypothetical protein
MPRNRPYVAFGIRALPPAEHLDFCFIQNPSSSGCRHHETLHRKMGGAEDDARDSTVLDD